MQRSYRRRYVATTKESGLARSFAQLLYATVSLAIVTPLVTAAPSHVSAQSLAAVAALGTFGTGLAYVIQYAILREVGSTTASTVTYVIPVTATIAGLLFLGESLRWNEPVGAFVGLAGVALTQGRLRYVPGRTRPSAAGKP